MTVFELTTENNDTFTVKTSGSDNPAYIDCAVYAADFADNGPGVMNVTFTADETRQLAAYLHMITH